MHDGVIVTICDGGYIDNSDKFISNLEGNLASTTQSSMPPRPGQATLEDFELGEEIAWGSLATVGFKVFIL